MSRLLLNFATGTSIVVCVLAGEAWERSHRSVERLEWAFPAGHDCATGYDRYRGGSFSYRVGNATISLGERHFSPGPPPPTWWTDSIRVGVIGCGGPYEGALEPGVIVRFPLWMVCAAGGVLPLAGLRSLPRGQFAGVVAGLSGCASRVGMTSARRVSNARNVVCVLAPAARSVVKPFPPSDCLFPLCCSARRLPGIGVETPPRTTSSRRGGGPVWDSNRPLFCALSAVSYASPTPGWFSSTATRPAEWRAACGSRSSTSKAGC